MAFSFVAHRANICSSCLKYKSRASISLMKRIKTDGHASLSATLLSSLIRICMEGPNPADFDSISSMQYGRIVLR